MLHALLAVIGVQLEQQAEPILTWQWIIVSYHLQVLAVPGSPGISRKNPIKREMLQQIEQISVIQADLLHLSSKRPTLRPKRASLSLTTMPQLLVLQAAAWPIKW